ncbi:MAG: enoyl-CoA hydratase/isomerase family protein, partial [Longimicrobiales bacterium]
MAFETIRLDIEEKVATLWLDRKPRHLLNIAMMEEINAALLSLREHRTLEVLILRGADRTFCDGIDLKEHTQKRVQRLLQVFMRIFETMRMSNLISIAAVEGHAVGAGFELTLGCNLIVAAEDALFALPQVKMGIIAPVAAAVLPRVAPRRRAMEWVLTGNPISAGRLEHDGVINRVFPPASFEAGLDALLGEITDKSAPVLHLAKRAQFEAYYATFPEALASIQTLY